MQTTTKINKATPNRPRTAGHRGWIAFAVGMTAMFALLTIWVVLVEMGGERGSETGLMAQRAQASALNSQDACQGGAISDCR